MLVFRNSAFHGAANDVTGRTAIAKLSRNADQGLFFNSKTQHRVPVFIFFEEAGVKRTKQASENKNDSVAHMCASFLEGLPPGFSRESDDSVVKLGQGRLPSPDQLG